MPEYILNLSMIIPGNPVPKGRPRYGKGRVYTPKKTKNFERLVASLGFLARVKSGRKTPITAEKVVMNMYFAIRETGRIPDLDNLIKSISDALNGVWYEDDKQITIIHAIRDPVPLGREFTGVHMKIYEEATDDPKQKIRREDYAS